ncbi:MAG TPA: hypothetical protein DEG69_18450 [Flavobacteriaceae bacterium]|nr:hypothetical protein [Flavobacteriaceae bacterium]
MERYIVETLEITQNFYVVEAESEERAKEISDWSTDNWHNTLNTTYVSCNKLDKNYIKYLQKKPYWNDITTSYDKYRCKYYEDYGIKSNSYKMSSVTHAYSYQNDYFSTINKTLS